MAGSGWSSLARIVVAVVRSSWIAAPIAVDADAYEALPEREKTALRMHSFTPHALEALADVPESRFKQGLQQLAEFAVSRTF